MRKIKSRKRLANMLLKNYVLSYFGITVFVSIFLVTTLLVALALYININRLDINDAAKIMKNNYKEIDTTEIEKLNGFLEIIDSSHKVIYRKGNNPLNTTQYTPRMYYEMYEIFNNETKQMQALVGYDKLEKKYVFSTAYNNDKDFLLVIAVPEKEYFKSLVYERKFTPKNYLYVVIILNILMFIVFFLIVSRVTSKNLTKPLKLLTKGAREISKGNYDTRIELKSKNEFGELRDAFNNMAEKIAVERTLKEKAEENRKNLILDISHDLKNPLSSILGYSEYILKDSNLSQDEIKKYIETIRHNSERANKLIMDLFEFSKLESSEFKLNLVKQDVCEFLRELIAVYIPQFEDNNIDYEFDIPEESVFIHFDAKNLDRALSNLIINAIKYNSQNIKVIVKAHVVGSFFEIIVEDNGEGIPKDMQQHIFNAFVRVDASRNSESGGTGLGLAISKEIIEKHRGTIELQSDTNKGCKFIIKLPIN
ncbi:ATPase/histidine kinase/DNA gyrase B/HSP90 domain protein [Clostridiales bacterium oral taxon 876 str. F0540]|nr:ATPase/histidine kinase/DNA gyrase B/HSP90 domain protein [Clostridiales bacterium oral taxon 876 str. F0540]